MNCLSTHIDPNLQYFVTGGKDGAVRVWKYSNRELITQYSEHRKGVLQVSIDSEKPNIVHSLGGDSTVLSYDLKLAKRIIGHTINGCTMHCLTQRKDSELELVTGDSHGCILYWDIDVREPVMELQSSRNAIRTAQISNSGKFLAFAGEDTVLKILHVESNQMVSMGESHSNTVRTIAWTPDDRQILTGGDDNCLTVWNFFLA